MRFCLLACCICLFHVVTAVAADFERDIAPLLVRRCLECHKGPDPSGGLSLESADGIARGGDSGPVVRPGSADDSLLLQRVLSGEMPPPVKGVEQQLPQHEAATLSDWIMDGADWPRDRRLDLYEVTTDIRGGRDWWSFQPVRRPDVPEVAAGGSIANPIDAFIVATLAEHGMQPAPRADNRVLTRRLYQTTIGLPPTADELDRCAANHDSDSLIDKLLSSPHFGERWARHWLDLVRYAETSGYERDQPKPFAWKYRDWIVEAINTDLPYDQFVLQQLAGDEIPGRTKSSVIATGFLRLGTWNDEPNDDEDYRYERIEDMVHVASSAFLGLTVKCARCHDHKFDPIPQHDYYRIASAFWPGPIAARDRALVGGPSADELGFDDVLGWTDLSATPPPLHVLKSGERHQPLHEAVPGALTLVPALFTKFTSPADGSRTTGRRRQLAEWIVDPRNPLTARVFVDRIWQHHFGEGLVRSPNNFGYKGDLPTHPKLLDWLADEFVRSGWSAKHVHRLILTSNTWQQSSLHPNDAEYSDRDSANRLWWRANRRRLDAEALRDAMLAASGELDLRLGGESFRPAISAEALEGLSRKEAAYQASSPEDQRRRSLYSFVSRSLMPPMMTTFDQCDTTLPCGQRDVTTVPTQALAMLNNEFVHARSTALAARVIAAVPEDTHEQIIAAWRFALGRSPNEQEHDLAMQHLRTQSTTYGLSFRHAFESLCHVLLNSNELLYVD